jgi:carboxymethylenebutenolidase
MADNPRQNVTFPSNGGHAHGYLAAPSAGSGPGVIVIQEWWGLDDHIADLTDRFAAEGFVALAPDLYGGKVAHDADEAGAMLGALPVDQAAKDLSGSVDYLLGREEVTGDSVGAVGFCMGGGFVLLLAAQQGDRVSAAVPFYGIGPGLENADLSKVKADVLAHYAEDDAFYPADAARDLEKRLTADAGGTVTFHLYPGVGHAFHNDKDRLGTYDEASAQLAWQRTVDFLHTKLG